MRANTTVVSPVIPTRIVSLVSAARYLGVSSGKLHQLMEAGHVPTIVLPTPHGQRRSHILFDVADLDRCIERWKVGAA